MKPEEGKKGSSSKLQLEGIGKLYEIKNTIGKGAYGMVLEGVEKKTGQKVAIKQINKLFSEVTICKRILREITLMRLVNHPNIVKLIDIQIEGTLDNFETLYLIMEFCDSDLRKIFKSSMFLSEHQIQHITYSLLLGIRYLHNSLVMHRDLKPANILIQQDCSIRICDFGLARTYQEYTKEKKEDITGLTTKIGSLEIQEAKGITKEVTNGVQAEVIYEVTEAEMMKQKNEILESEEEDTLRKSRAKELTKHVVTR